MAIAAAHLNGAESLTDASSYVTASVSLTAGRLYLLSVTSVKSTAGTANAATATGASQTWEEVASIVSPDSSLRRLTVLRCVATSTTAGALTIAFGGQTQTAMAWSLDEFTGINTGNNGADSIVQNNNNTNTSATSLTVTLSAFERATNATFGALRLGPAGGVITHEAGYTELFEVDGTDVELQTQFLASSDTTPSWTWASSSNNNVGIALEIRGVEAIAAATTALAVTANAAKPIVKPAPGAVSLAVTAYDATVSFVAPPRTVLLNSVDWTEYLKLDNFSLVTCANRGEVGTGGVDVKDLASTLDVPALKTFIVEEPAAGGSNKRLYTGFTHDRTIEPYDGTSSREWGIELTDLNVLFGDFILLDSESADRPSETDYARMTWLLTTRLGTEAGVSAGVVPNSNTVTMEATDYRGRKPADVAAECSEAASKLHFIYDYGSGRKLYYDLATGTSLSSTAKISDTAGDPDGSTVFAIVGKPKLKKSPDRIYSGVYLKYNEGTVYVTDGTTATDYRTREATVLDASISGSTLATTKANALLAGADEELVELDSLSIVVSDDHANDIRAGQRVQIKLSKYGLGTYTYYRVIRTNHQPWNSPDGNFYLLTLGVASDVLASANGGRGGDDIWQNKSNANDDGATVIVDRGGITVTDGAITVTNSGAVVIIDGSSDMFKIGATGTLSASAAGWTSGAVVYDDDATAQLTGLGTLSLPPLHLSTITFATATNNARLIGTHVSEVTDPRYVAATSGGSPTNRIIGTSSFSRTHTKLDGGYAVVTLSAANVNAGAYDAFARYHVLLEASI